MCPSLEHLIIDHSSEVLCTTYDWSVIPKLFNDPQRKLSLTHLELTFSGLHETYESKLFQIDKNILNQILFLRRSAGKKIKIRLEFWESCRDPLEDAISNMLPRECPPEDSVGV